MRVVLSTAGVPTSAIAASSSARLPTAAKAAGRPPSLATKLFSAIRSCATRSEAGEGCTGTFSASHSTGSTAIFSNS